MSEDSWRTHRLELDDQTLRDWDAAVLDAGPEGIVLDRSAFYPGGGGQPPDNRCLDKVFFLFCVGKLNIQSLLFHLST